MLATKRHGRTDGCWTCKLRRKRCDELRPICGDCDTLEIACVYGSKPTWMDNGKQQRQKTLSIKDEIKRNAAYRREKANDSNIRSKDATNHSFNIISNITVSHAQPSTKSVESAVPGGQEPILHSSNEHQHCLIGVGQSPAIETDFIMKYLDFVFPSLFPFYRPSLFETGRSWLLVLLGKNKVAYHAAVSLTCYFFTMALADTGNGEEHTDCQQLRWKEVEQQTKECFSSLRMEMSGLGTDPESTHATKLELVEILVSIIHILVFEIALGRSAAWNSHLSPAFALLEEIMEPSDVSYQSQDQSKLTLVLLGIGRPLWTKPGEEIHVWSPDQAGSRFCAGLLIFIDVVASTATRTAPKLLKYHSDVLARVDDGDYTVTVAEVRLSAFVGCRNWVVRSIGEISALDLWKQEQMEAGNLPATELVDRALRISDDLMNKIFTIQGELKGNPPSNPHHRAPFDTSPDPLASSKSTLVWAHAARLYLEVVVHGWRLSSAVIRANVAQIIELLQNVPSYQLRAFAWPLCIAGCLALEEEESSFTTLFLNQGKVHTAGALDDARQIMDKVWQIRPMLDPVTWNFASCFAILGSPVLLV